MPRARTVCKRGGCPWPVERDGWCVTDLAIREAARGSSTARGYGADHRRARTAATPAVDAGRATCWRCGERIRPGEPWDMGHDDSGRERGPEHASGCNRRAAALKGHGKPWTPR